ncbi:MAG: 6-phospho-beta-glucosidase [Myxococcota bacterium]
MKIAVVGGGSTYTPELLHGLVERAESLGLERVVLEDVRPDRLTPVTGFCQRMARAMGSDVTVEATTELDEALRDADFVVNQIRVGGQEGRHEDIRLGLDLGIVGQETTGVGGFAKALRTVPVALDLARRMDDLCPDAWMLNFTNPSGLVTEALLNHGRDKVVGLCNVPIEMHMEIAAVLGREVEEVSLDWVGLNHLGWCRRVLVDGEDVLPGMIEQIESGVAGPANLPELRYPDGFLKALGMIPSSYVRFFYATDEMLQVIQAKKKSRAQEVMELEERLLALYRDPDQDTLPDLLSERGGAWYSRLAVDIVGALASETPSVHIVNTLSRGAVEGMPDDASVEIPCTLSRDGVVPNDCGAVEEEILGLMRHVKSYERLAVEAAVGRSRQKAYMALVANPLVPNARVAKQALDRLVARDLI